jgi:hypothetical protein
VKRRFESGWAVAVVADVGSVRIGLNISFAESADAVVLRAGR